MGWEVDISWKQISPPNKGHPKQKLLHNHAYDTLFIVFCYFTAHLSLIQMSQSSVW